MASEQFENLSRRKGTLARHRAGTGSLDLLVSFTLLITAMTVATPLIVRHGRLLKSHRDYRLALDELSNQIDRLTALSPDELAQAAKQVSPSAFIAERLPGARLDCTLEPADVGTHVALTLSWNEAGRVRAPVALAAWVFNSKPAASKESAEAKSP
jgi:hypothetical protein